MNRRLLIPLLLSLGLMIFLAVHFIIDLNRVHSLMIAAGSKQGESYILSQAIAQVIAKHEPKIKIQLLETKGTDLLDKFEKVVEALDKDRITPESFQSFTFTWEAAMSAMRDRKIWLAANTISHLT
ncbi:hypothetical protein VB735_12075 [Halotia wernerae UHCC 0503]|nr:hypothetical protein [Halotia wernerae UHCC 0503]